VPRKKKQPEPVAEPKKPTLAERWATMGRVIEMLRPRANRGDQEARAVLRRFFNSNPHLWTWFGDLADTAERTVLEALTEHEWLVTEAIRHEAAEMRTRLAGPSPTPLEEMAVRRIVASWLNLHAVQMQCAKPPRDLGWARFWQRQLELAERMYDSAVRSLALIKQFLPGDTRAIELQAPANWAKAEMTDGRSGRNGVAAIPDVLTPPSTNGHVNRVNGFFDAGAVGNDGASITHKANAARPINRIAKRRGTNGVAVH